LSINCAPRGIQRRDGFCDECETAPDLSMPEPQPDSLNRLEDRHLDTMDFIGDAFRDDITMEGGVLAQVCAALYYQPDDDPPPADQANR
jgi:hypothetical protein